MAGEPKSPPVLGEAPPKSPPPLGVLTSAAGAVGAPKRPPGLAAAAFPPKRLPGLGDAGDLCFGEKE